MCIIIILQTFIQLCKLSQFFLQFLLGFCILLLKKFHVLDLVWSHFCS